MLSRPKAAIALVAVAVNGGMLLHSLRIDNPIYCNSFGLLLNLFIMFAATREALISLWRLEGRAATAFSLIWPVGIALVWWFVDPQCPR